MRRRILAAVTAASFSAVTLISAVPASATDFSTVLDNPAYWQAGNQADIIQWVNMSYGSSHPRYSTHRVDVLLDDGGRPVAGTTYLKLTTNFAAISGTTSQDEFVSAVRLPAGVTVTDTASTPIFCRIAPGALLSDAPVAFQPVVDGTCRQGVKDMGSGVLAVNDRVLNRGDVWEVYVPVSSSSAISGSPVSFLATHANQDATEPSIAEATNMLVIGAGGPAVSSAVKVGAKCVKAGARSGKLVCAKVKGKLVWKRR